MGKVFNFADYQDRNVSPARKPEANNMGFVSIHRKIKDTSFYKDSEAVHLFLHLILSANHADTVLDTDYGQMMIKRGQMISSAAKLERETGISIDRIKYLLKKFKKESAINTKSPGKFTVITITNYGEFQGENTVKKLPEDYPKITRANVGVASSTDEVLPEDYPKITPNNNIYINSSPNGEESATPAKKSKGQKNNFTCEEVWQALKDELPEARGWRVMDDARRNMIKRFWGKANKIARSLDDGQPLTLEGFRDYLKYIRANCRWMLEDRPDNRSGRTWRRKKFDAFLDEKLYLEVREGDQDDF